MQALQTLLPSYLIYNSVLHAGVKKISKVSKAAKQSINKMFTAAAGRLSPADANIGDAVRMSLIDIMLIFDTHKIKSDSLRLQALLVQPDQWLSRTMQRPTKHLMSC